MDFRKWKLALAGFVAGAAFVAACSEDVKSVAEEIAQAISISFNNSGTGLSATNVQGALVELDTRTSGGGGGGSGGGTWLVKDKNGVVIYETPRPDKCFDCGHNPHDSRCGYNSVLNLCIDFGDNSISRSYYYYAAANCTGTPHVYVAVSGSNIYSIVPVLPSDPTRYAYLSQHQSAQFEKIDYAGSVVSNFSYQSRRYGSAGDCQPVVNECDYEQEELDECEEAVPPEDCSEYEEELAECLDNFKLLSARPVTITPLTVPFEYPFTEMPTWERN